MNQRFILSDGLFNSPKLREMPVSRVLYWTIICLDLKLPVGSSDACEHDGPPHNAQLILHQVGFTERTSRQAAGELLPRLSTLTVLNTAVYFCCTFPEVASAGISPASCPMVLGLSSSGFRRLRPSGILVKSVSPADTGVFRSCHRCALLRLP